MGLRAARGERPRDPEQDELSLLGEVGQVHLLVGRALEKVDRGDGVAGLGQDGVESKAVSTKFKLFKHQRHVGKHRKTVKESQEGHDIGLLVQKIPKGCKKA